MTTDDDPYTGPMIVTLMNASDPQIKGVIIALAKEAFDRGEVVTVDRLPPFLDGCCTLVIRDSHAATPQQSTTQNAG